MEPLLNCFLCSNLVPRGVQGLANHLSNDHGIALSERLPRTDYVCAQNGCRDSFVYFYNLRKHIEKKHLNNVGDPNRVPPNEHIQDENESIQDGDDIPQDSGSDVEDENIERMEDQLQIIVIRMISRLLCNASLTEDMMTNFLQEFDRLLRYIQSSLQNRILSKLRLGDAINQDLINDVTKIFQFKSPFKDLCTWKEQKEALIKHCRFIEPCEVPLGNREDNRLDKETNTFIRSQVMETYSYVSIIEVLKMVLKNKSIREAIASEEPSPDNYLKSFRDGLHFQKHPFFQRYKQAIRIKLYYDDLEIVNPLGSKTGVHKLGAFYYVIDNIPPHLNSELSSIHVLLLCSHANIVHFKFEKVLKLFMSELAQLESDEGIAFDCDGEEYILRASLMTFCGDGLAIHEIYNMLSPSANQFCRMCMYSRADLHAASLERAPSRTKELYDEHLELLESTNFSDATKKMTGLKGNSILNESKYFHICNNKVFDIMHDWLCGICPMVVKLVLNQFVIEDKLFDINYLNTAILLFNYGYTERKNKPSPNFTRAMLAKKDHTLSQKAMQMWCLTRALPFLLSEKLEEDNNYMELISCVLQIMELIFAPKMQCTLLTYINELMKDFIQKFCSLFPDVDLINKIHHETHAAECIRWSGPLTNYACMRFEAKHGLLKLRAQNVNNFKNPPKTLMKICQCTQSAKWGFGDVPLHSFKIISGKTKFVSNTVSRLELINIGYTDDDFILSAKSVSIDGVEFRNGLYIVVQKASDEYEYPIFGKIKEIIVLEDESTYFYTLIYRTNLFDTSLHAYQIEVNSNEDSQRFIEKQDLQYYKPLSDWKKSTSSETYISLRHIIL